MEAPGYALLCKKGHLFSWYEEHLYWDDQLWKDLEDKEKVGCPCGEKKTIRIAHYGGLNDCICIDSEIPTRGIRGLSSQDYIGLEPIIGAVDSDGNLIEAYSKLYLDKYYIPPEVLNGDYAKA